MDAETRRRAVIAYGSGIGAGRRSTTGRRGRSRADSHRNSGAKVGRKEPLLIPRATATARSSLCGCSVRHTTGTAATRPARAEGHNALNDAVRDLRPSVVSRVGVDHGLRRVADDRKHVDRARASDAARRARHAITAGAAATTAAALRPACSAGTSRAAVLLRPAPAAARSRLGRGARCARRPGRGSSTARAATA